MTTMVLSFLLVFVPLSIGLKYLVGAPLGALAETAGALRLSLLFLGVIVLEPVGTIADLFPAAWFAHKKKMGLVLNICVGSAIQVALVVAPLLVIMSWFMGRPMNLVVFQPTASLRHRGHRSDR